MSKSVRFYAIPALSHAILVKIVSNASFVRQTSAGKAT
jgi:hypothetical protein